ncbi:MAG: hypothetical protein IBX36_03295 [Dehalococcoidia bacterium]|nr:hypothetical protein [Dehalococcoidia bacterium]
MLRLCWASTARGARGQAGRRPKAATIRVTMVEVVMAGFVKCEAFGRTIKYLSQV